MKKLFYLIIITSVLTAGCNKKNKDDEKNNEEEQTYECLPKSLNYTDHADPNKNESTTYFYRKNLIDHKVRNFSDGTSYRYNYIYQDETKGLLSRIDILIQGQVVAKVNYTIQNDKTTQRELVLLQNGNSSLAWTISYSYNNDKVTQIRIQDYDLWNNGANPTDETEVLTYTGDNVTNIKLYDTADMNTLKEEYMFEYDDGKRAFDNVSTQTYPQTRVNNVTRYEKHIYGTNPSTDIELTTITYNNKNFPTSFESTDDRGNATNTMEVTYDNCN